MRQYCPRCFLLLLATSITATVLGCFLAKLCVGFAASSKFKTTISFRLIHNYMLFLRVFMKILINFAANLSIYKLPVALDLALNCF